MHPNQRKQGAILGALVADAASLGFHWLYDADRLADVAGAKPEFAAPNPRDYEGVAGYFAHADKSPGDVTHYGEQMAVALRSLAQNGGAWMPADYLAEFRATFERGGSFSGYIDAATRGTLDNAKEAEAKGEGEGSKEDVELSLKVGADDAQMPAFSKLPPIVARYAGDPRLLEIAEEAIRITNNHDEAVAYALFGARALEQVILGESILHAMKSAAAEAPDSAREVIESALALDENRPKYIAEHFGAACYTRMAMPVSVTILRDHLVFVDGVRQNIFAGGDNAGRGIFVGAMLGAAGGIGGDGIPLSWLSRLSGLERYLTQVEAACAED